MKLAMDSALVLVFINFLWAVYIYLPLIYIMTPREMSKCVFNNDNDNRSGSTLAQVIPGGNGWLDDGRPNVE